jgi:signal transduction histidine kinase
MEDKLLLETLAPAISISIHSLNLQQRMIQARQMESIHRVASFIMHDLRNAVSTLSLLARNARQHIDKPDFRVDFIATLARLSDEMQHLMNRLAEVKSGGELRNRNRCDPARLLSEALLDVQLPDEIKLAAEIPSLPEAFWDERLIRVVLRNILGNAVDAMPAGGVLEVSARPEGAEIIITIKDTGMGMSCDFIRKHLFRPNHSTKSKGLGIGLFQSREILLAHRGTIQVQSLPGQGTTFTIQLPCGRDNEAAERPADVTLEETTALEQWEDTTEAGFEQR